MMVFLLVSFRFIASSHLLAEHRVGTRPLNISHLLICTLLFIPDILCHIRFMGLGKTKESHGTLLSRGMNHK